MYSTFAANHKFAKRVMKGFIVKSRPSGSVHTVKSLGNGDTVAELCVGVRTVRLNLRDRYLGSQPLVLSGHSETWVGGGVPVTEDNIDVVRSVLGEISGAGIQANGVAGKDLSQLEVDLLKRLTTVAEEMREIEAVKKRIEQVAGIKVAA